MHKAQLFPLALAIAGLHCLQPVVAFTARVVVHKRPSTSRSLFSSKSNVENSPTIETVDFQDVVDMSLTTQQSIQTFSYRASLLGALAVYSFQVALPVLKEAGLSTSFTLVDNNGLVTALTVAACALAPKAGKSAKLVDGKILAASVATAVAGQPLLGLAAIFVREIYYFGAAYKVEAAVGVIASLATWFLPEMAPTSNAVVCLALAVMVFGKFLEPLEEDWQPNQSEFLAQREMK